MNRLSNASLAVLLLGLECGAWPIACVDSGRNDNAATGGLGSIALGTGGASTDGGGTATLGGCGSNVDTTGDGTAGTTSTGPYRWKSVTIRGGGFVDGIIFSPIQKDLVFARTDMGGAYRYDPANHGWVPLTDWISRANSNWIGIESIAPDPVNPDIVYMAAGTYLSSTNTAILRSTDGGNTFVAYSILSIPMGGNHDGRSMGERLAVDPNLPSTLYFGSRQNGLLRSTDSGANWSVVSTFPVLGGKSSSGTALGLSFVLFDPKSGSPGGSSTVYVGVADTAAGSNLYVTNDGGDNWKLVEGGPTGLMPHHAVLDASSKLYLAYNNGPGPNGITLGAVWKYDTKANTFADVSPGTHGIGGISLDVSKPDTLVVATIDWWAPDEIYRTTDGGAHWTGIGRGAKHEPNGAVWLHWGAAGCALPHDSGWMGDIEIDPFNSDHVMYVTGQGIWSTQNASADAPALTWTFDNRNLEQTAITDMMPSVNGAFLSCVGDIGGMRHENLDVPSTTGMYNNPISSNCTSIDFAGKDPNIVYRAGNPDSSNATKYGGYSQDSGKTWTVFPTMPLGATSCSGGGKLAVSADGTTVLWSIRCTAPSSDAGAVQAIAVSSDFGATWGASSGVPTNAAIAADRVNPAKFYAYSYTNNVGTFYVSTDGGRSFATANNATAFTSRGVIRPVFGIEGDVWMIANAVLYHSTQSGTDFITVDSVQAAYAIGFGKPADGQSYPAIYLFGKVKDVVGFFRSEDEAVTFSRIDDDQHQFGTAGYIAGDEDVYGRVYIGTNGRGIIYGDPN